uniref:hypothetical protein n=1 Tax=Collinsella bouchesdurhonensis TaxID=1907654 RepID=UPI00359CB2EF
MSDAQNTDRLGVERLELVCKVASIALFVAAFMLAAVGAIHLAVLPGIIEPHLHNVAIEMALLALLLAAASAAVGVMGMMFVHHNYDAKRLLPASLGLAALAIAGVLLARFVIRGIFGMGSLTRPGVLVVLCSAAIAFVCAKTLPKKPAAESAKIESAEGSAKDGAEANDGDADAGGAAAEDERAIAEPEPELDDTSDDDLADDESPSDGALEGDAADAADVDLSGDDDSFADELDDDAFAQGAHFGTLRDDR